MHQPVRTTPLSALALTLTARAPGIVPEIRAVADAAAVAYRSSLTAPAPRGAMQWVTHCRACAAAAAAAIYANPPAPPDERGTASRLLDRLNRTIGFAPEIEADPNELFTRAQPEPCYSDSELAQCAAAAAAQAYRSALPLLTSRSATRSYIACVAAGVADGHVTAVEARQLTYAAQLALAAWKPGKPARA